MEFVLTHPDEGIKSIVVLFDGVPYEADSDHPWWDEIVGLTLADDPRVLDLFPIRPVQQPSQETSVEEFSEGLKADLDMFFELRGIDPLTKDDYSEEELAQIREIYNRHGEPKCDNLECRFCWGPYEVPQTLDKAIACGVATEDERCEGENCRWCHPLPFVGTIDLESYEDALADPEIQETLRRARIGRDLVEESVTRRSEETQQRDREIDALDALVVKWRERAQFLESAVKQYAGHIWNDIEQRLSGVPDE